MRSIDLLASWLKEHGYESKQITLGHQGQSKFLLISKKEDDRQLLFSARRLSFPPTTSATRDITSDKTKTYDLAAHFGINYPSTILIDANNYDRQVIEHFLQASRPVVVKPRNGLESKGVSLDIREIEPLEKAIELAAGVGNKVIIQKQVEGQEIRLVIIDKKVKAALLRQKPQVIGDGSSSLAELIQKENESRRNIAPTLVPYPPLEGALLSDTLHMEYVPAEGEVIELSRATMIRNGASVYEILKDLDKSYVKLTEELCAPLIAPMLCMDIMATDYTQPANDVNYNLIELNLGMSLPLCYSCRDGKHFTVIEDYLGPKALKEFELLQ